MQFPQDVAMSIQISLRELNGIFVHSCDVAGEERPFSTCAVEGWMYLADQLVLKRHIRTEGANHD